MQQGVAESFFMVMDGPGSGFDACPAVAALAELAAEPVEIRHHVRECRITAGVTRTEFPTGRRSTDDHLLGAGRQPAGRPADAITMARKHLVGGDRITIDAIGCDVDVSVAGMLDTIDDDKAIGRCLADRRRDCRDIHRYAGHRRGLDDRRHAHIAGDVTAIGIGIDASGLVIMLDQDMLASRHIGPARHGTARRRVFERRRQHDAAFGCPKCCRAHQPEQQFGAAFADEDLALGSVEEHPHVGLALVDHRHQGLRCGVVTALIVGDGRIDARGLGHRLERQGASGILQEHTWALEGARIDMREAGAYVSHQSRDCRQHLSFSI